VGSLQAGRAEAPAPALLPVPGRRAEKQRAHAEDGETGRLRHYLEAGFDAAGDRIGKGGFPLGEVIELDDAVAVEVAHFARGTVAVEPVVANYVEVAEHIAGRFDQIHVAVAVDVAREERQGRVPFEGVHGGLWSGLARINY